MISKVHVRQHQSIIKLKLAHEFDREQYRTGLRTDRDADYGPAIGARDFANLDSCEGDLFILSCRARNAFPLTRRQNEEQLFAHSGIRTINMGVLNC